MIKVVHVSTSDVSIGVLLLNQLEQFRAAGYEVVAVCNPGPYVPRIEATGVRVVTVRMLRAVTPWADVASLARLTQVLRRERPAIVHTHTPKAGLLGQYAALLAGVPVRVHTIHGLYLPGHMTPRTRPLYVALERVTMWPAHLSLSQNPEDIPVAVEERICHPARITLLGNGIDLSRFDPARIDAARVQRLRAEFGFAADDPVVGIVGRVNREKGYVEFFQAAARIAARVPKVRFLVVGPVESEKFDALDPMKLARDNGVEDRVVYLGLRDDMPEMYALMTLLVLPSHREGFPRAPMEASAMGLPVVATNVRGCRQVVVDGQTGFLTPLRDPEGLADAIVRVLEDLPLARRMGDAARVYALEKFDERQAIRRTLDAYGRLLGQARG